MKNAPRTLSGIAITAIIIICSLLAAAPASAVALLNAAGGVLSGTPGIETVIQGLIGLGCLGLARQRANL
jgi:hypothetical protein